jgi:ssDNA-binding Zn-finger/Zn-ribbon topoisomerase 1
MESERAPICPACGVTALPAQPANVLDTFWVCDNAECADYDQVVR